MSLVFIVNNDTPRSDSLASMMRSTGWDAVVCADADEYLDQPRARIPSCLIADTDSAGWCGRELRAICAARPETPVICTSLQPTLRGAVLAIKAGAQEFLREPFEPQSLLQAVRCAFDCSQEALCREAVLGSMSTRYARLSPREREVMSQVVAGRLNKQIAHELGISLITVKTHRGRVMRKMQAASLPDLVTLAARLGEVSNPGELPWLNRSTTTGGGWSSLPPLPSLSRPWPGSHARASSRSAC